MYVSKDVCLQSMIICMTIAPISAWGFLYNRIWICDFEIRHYKNGDLTLPKSPKESLYVVYISRAFKVWKQKKKKKSLKTQK